MKYFYFLIFIFTLLSCFADRYKLDKEEIEFNPYQIGDKIVFESNLNEIDTFFISNIDLVFNDGIGITEYKQVLRISEGKAPKEGDIFDHRTFLLKVRSGGSKEPTIVEFRNFDGKKIYLKELLSSPKKRFVTSFGTYNDVIEINGRSDEKIESLIYKFQWSLKNGIIQFEKGDSSIWTLKKFLRPDK